MSREITIKNVGNFFKGNFKYYMDKIIPVPSYIREQIDYRLDKCKDDCLKTNKCINCSCPPRKKAFIVESCNPTRFPDLMEEEEWEKFKEYKDGPLHD